MGEHNVVLEAIQSRRSVRSFEAKPVEKHLIEEVISAGNWAASAVNIQPWRFVVIQDDELKAIIREVAGSVLTQRLEKIDDKHPMAPFYFGTYAQSQGWKVTNQEEFKAQIIKIPDPLYGAPVLICVIGTGGHMNFDCPAVCQNMIVAAHSLGLGSIWTLTTVPALEHPEVKDAIELSEGEKVFGVIFLGYPHIVPDLPPKKPPIVKWL